MIWSPPTVTIPTSTELPLTSQCITASHILSVSLLSTGVALWAPECHKSPAKIVLPLQRGRKKMGGGERRRVHKREERCLKWFTTPLREQARRGQSFFLHLDHYEARRMIPQGAEDIQMYKSKIRMIQSSLGSAQLKEKKNSGKNIHLLSLSH